VAFYGLWPEMTSFELWLGIADEHEEPWVVARVGECAGVSVLVVASTDGSRWIALLSESLTSGSPGTLQTMFVFGNSTWRYSVWSVAWFLHVLYRLWPIGVATRHFEILNRRCRRLLTWLWPCERTGTRFPDILYYTWWWPCGGKVTSLPRGVSMYMVVAMWWEWSKRCGKWKDIIYGCGHAV